jgi:hypothetical protein
MAGAAAANRVVETTDNERPPLITRDQLVADHAHLEKAISEIEANSKTVPSVCEDDEDLAVITKLGTSINDELKRIDKAQKEQVRPFLDGQTTVNAYLKHDLPGRLAPIKAALESVATTYQRKKAAKEQAARDAAAKAAREQAEAAQAKVAQAVQAGDVAAATVAVKQTDSLTAFANKAASQAAAPISTMAKVATEAGTASLRDNWTFDDLDMNYVDLETLRPFIVQAAIEQALRAYIKAGRREIKGARIFNDNKTSFRK